MRERLVLLGTLVLGSCVADGATSPRDDREPEPPAVALATAVSGVVQPGASSTFLFEAPEYTPMRIFLQGTGGSPSDTLIAIVRFAGSATELGRVSSPSNATGQFAHWVNIGALPARARFDVEVRGGNPSTTGAFSLISLPPDDGPEHASDSLPLREVVTEPIDIVSDVDRFALHGAAGDEFLVLIGKLGTNRFTRLVANVTTQSGAVLQSTSEVRGGHALGGRSLIVAFPTAGVRYLVLNEDRGSGAYPDPWDITTVQLFVQPINRGPESSAAAITRGDTISEAIDYLGDIDEFTFSAQPGEDFRVAVALPVTLESPITVTVLCNETIVDSISAQNATPSFDVSSTSVLRAEGCAYRVRVSSTQIGSPTVAAAAYQLALIPYSSGPESVPATLTLGSPVVGESIDFSGDVDEFALPLAEGKLFSARISGNATAQLIAPNGALLDANLTTEVEIAGASESAIARVVPGGGEHRIRVVGAASGNQPYELTVWEIDTLPETIPGTFPLGTWVTSEAFEVPGDVDLIRFSAAAGETVIFVLEPSADTTIGYSNWAAPYREPDDWWSQWNLNLEAARTWNADTSGEYRVGIRGTHWLPDGSARAGYRVYLGILDTLPEVASPVFSIGDSITTEAIEIVFDRDYFRTTAPPGVDVDIFIQGDAPPAGCGTSVYATVDNSFATAASSGGQVGWNRFRVPSSGELVVRVLANGTSNRCTALPYRLWSAFAP